MFSDPTTITVGTEDLVLPRISVGNMTSSYRNSDGSFSLEIAHSANKRERSVAKVIVNKVGSDPFNQDRSKPYMAQHYLVSDAPLNGVGFTDAELETHIRALAEFLLVPGNIAKFLGKES